MDAPNKRLLAADNTYVKRKAVAIATFLLLGSVTAVFADETAALTCFHKDVSPAHLEIDYARHRVLRSFEGKHFGWSRAKISDEYVIWSESWDGDRVKSRYRLDRYTGTLTDSSSGGDDRLLTGIDVYRCKKMQRQF